MITTTLLIILFPIAAYLAYKNYLFQKEKSATIAKRGKYKEAYESTLAPLVECYVDSFDNKWYHFENLTQLPWKRSSEGNIFHKHSELAVTPEQYDEVLARLITAASGPGSKQKACEEVIKLVTRLQERRTWAAELRTVEGLANCYFILEGEDPSETSEYWFQKKKDIWAQDKDCHAFFLRSAWRTTRSFKDLSDTGIVSYMLNKAINDPLNQP